MRELIRDDLAMQGVIAVDSGARVALSADRYRLAPAE